MKKSDMPSVKSVAKFIKDSCGQNKKYIDIDMLELEGLYIIAWVMDTALSQNQGIYQAAYTECKNGKFSEVVYSEPCRYYEENGKRKITSCSFGSFPEEGPAPDLLEKKSDSPECQEAYMTLVCQDRPISQRRIFVPSRERV